MDASRTDEGARVALVALGCRVSRSDVDALACSLGPPYTLAGPGAPADYVVVNACAVTADADAAARQAVRRAAREHPGAPIVVAGCYGALRREDVIDLPGVVAVVGARSVPEVRRALDRLRAGPAGGDGEDAGPELGAAEAFGPAPRPHGHTRAFLKVQDGCDAACAYCVVPLARGRSRSLPLEEALARIEALGAESPEVVLTGVDLAAYGRDLPRRSSLAELVGAVAARARPPRLRLSSLEPDEVPLELFQGPARAVLCEHVHLPLQSGAPRVLAAMRRRYGPDAYARTVEAVVAAMPGACVGADVIAGFPGETDADHRATLALVERLPIAYLHVFPFSARPGTEAAGLPGQVDGAVARARARELADLSGRRWRAYLAAQRGRVLQVAVERVAGGMAAGTARNYATVRWPASGDRRGQLAHVRVEAADGEACLGVRAGVFQSRLPP